MLNFKASNKVTHHLQPHGTALGVKPALLAQGLRARKHYWKLLLRAGKNSPICCYEHATPWCVTARQFLVPKSVPFVMFWQQRQDLLSWYKRIQNRYVWVHKSRTRTGRYFAQKTLKIRTCGCPNCSLGSISSWQHILSYQVTLRAKLLLNSNTETKCP